MRDLQNAWAYVWREAGQANGQTAGSATVIWHSETTGEVPYHTVRYLNGPIILGRDAPWSNTLTGYGYAYKIMRAVYAAKGVRPPIFCYWDALYLPFRSSVPEYKEPCDTGCVWSAGWAAFFAAAAANDPLFKIPASPAPGTAPPDFYTLDLESATSNDGGVTADGVEVPVRVAGALWDLLDDRNDGLDRYSGSFAEIWDSFASAPPACFFDPDAPEADSYLLQWVERGHYSPAADQPLQVDVMRQNTIFP